MKVGAPGRWIFALILSLPVERYFKQMVVWLVERCCHSALLRCAGERT